MWESLSIFGSLGSFILDKSESTIVALALGVMVYFFNKYIKPRLKAGTEKEIAESLGIRINLSPTSVKYFPRSGRVSVKNTATTETREDTIRWGKNYPPNDERKRRQVEEWLINNS